MPRYRVQITAFNLPPAPVSDEEAAKVPRSLSFEGPTEEVFRQTFDELNVPAVIAFLNRARRVRRASMTPKAAKA